ncbi:helix-turn-helix transcriptional regulator [Kordia sp. YSTF-M3]|uniref:Helix-turn-helix transcriptional regulator n=1 Tax=Kordia aestuariivivens TaxID=2759037 RepID=A0ABR7Q3R7_9FLAO|nr:response regulator transcription factor [Kordia aestuariivivens]MBC8753157.1 helix-turn-helix transcriptional regulator [Kordia aestuariivivens]
MEFYKKAIANQDVKATYNAAHINAIIYNVLDQKDSAYYFVDISIAKAKDANDQQHYVNSLHLKGNIYYDADLYDKASGVLAEVYKLVEKGNNVQKLADIRHSIALVKKQVGLPKQAIELTKENLELYDKGTLDKESQSIKYINTLLNLSSIYLHLAESFFEDEPQYLDSVEIYNTIGLEKSIALNDLQGHSIFLTIEGIVHQKRGNLQDAFTDFIAAEKQIKDLGFYNQLSVLYQYEGKNFFLQNDYDNAIKYLLKVDSIVANSNTSSPSVQETYILLANCYEKKNDRENAVKYFKIFEEKDAKNDLLIRKTTENLYRQYDIPSLKSKIEKYRNESQKEQLKSQTLMYVCLFLILLSIISFWYYKKRERIQKKRFNTVLEELKEIELSQNSIAEKSRQSYTITDENIQKILDGLAKFEKKQLYLQKKCTLNYVAKKINTNSTYLSKTLQSHKQKKFVQYITDLRLNYALTQLKNEPRFRAYDIKSIAAELGFNTAESFSKAFKRRTGFYPSFYINSLNSLKENEINI